ncbi:flagellar basal-body MS-ring/collar protein FliF [Oceanobacillus chungangensis]|uniref:Flagellar M-ring protein n=1 Tax=Oceanobacillus chungangensis TaxID=1229152 RepID=A0A3D8PRE4_9BACI|nr:flagellar basal-body MS-ring/collar protein FliF [Oceanobacillus chungangensis]RDW17838.1 flagellar M-ring protein FliF [Oceanobacillus chungangensis]
MNEMITKWRENITTFWTKRTKSQKGIFIGSVAIVVLLIIGISLFVNNTKFVTLYNNLSLQEVGQIKTELDSRGVPYELDDGGTTISVPEEQVDTLLVDLAGQGIPSSGNIDYSFFSENSSFGITDNEFNIMKLDAMQSELANLITGIDGIENAQVMINMPEKPVFANETSEEASASIVLTTEQGYQFKGNQIESLYTLVSKAVPNLPADNIVIMNQYFEYFDRMSDTGLAAQDVYSSQQAVKQDIERDIRQRLQQMIGMMVGMDNVIVSVTADVDFTQENRAEELVEPVDLENMEGLPVSLETIQESYTGNAAEGGVPGAGEEDVTNFQVTQNGDGNGDYELDKETINYEFNRIRKEIVESPYKIRDLGIQVAVDSVRDSKGSELEYLSTQDQNAVEQGISSILDSIIATSIDDEFENVPTTDNTSIVFQEFTGSVTTPQATTPFIQTWMYVVGGILLAIIILLIVLLIRNRNKDEVVEEELMETETVIAEVPDIQHAEQTESDIRRQQLEKIAKEKPEEFAKLLRSWMGQD